MFKKTLLALAIAGAALNASATLTLTAGGNGTNGVQTVSAEGAQNTAALTPTDVTLTFTGDSALYSSLDKVRITLTGGALTPATNVGIAFNDISNGGSAASIGNLVSSGELEFSDDATVVTLTLDNTEATAINTALDATDTFVISGLNIDPTDSFSTSTAVSYTVEMLSTVGGALIDSGTGQVLDGVAQFDVDVASANRFNGVVDVGMGRLDFASNGTTDDSDTLTIAYTSAVVNHLPASAVGNAATFVVNGDFEFLDVDGDGDADGVTTTTTTPVVSTDFATLTETAAAFSAGVFDGLAADTASEVVTLAVDGETQVITPQSFSVDGSWNYAPATGSAQTFTETVNGGSFTLNGASAYISFLPLGSDFAQSVTVTNIGTVDGSITVDLVGNGTSVTETLTATAAPRSITQIGAEIKAIAAANGMDDSASVNITVNSPDANIRVDALYFSKSSQDRGVVLTGGNQ